MSAPSRFLGTQRGLWLAPRRAGTALPSYLALLHAGFAVPPLSPAERWALTPPFHPCQMSLPLLDVSEVFLGPVTEAAHTGGLFSVALSVARSTSLRVRYKPPGVTRRVTLRSPDFPPARPQPKPQPHQRSSDLPASFHYTLRLSLAGSAISLRVTPEKRGTVGHCNPHPGV